MSNPVNCVLIQMPRSGLEPFIGIAQLCGYLRRHNYPVEVFDLGVDLYHRYREKDTTLWAEEIQVLWQDKTFVDRFLENDRTWIEKEYLECIDRAEKMLVGFSVSATQLMASLWMARLIKSWRPDAVIVFGGEVFGASNDVRDETLIALNSGVVDAAVIGEGEETLRELLERVRQGRSIEDCPGLWIRGENGKPVLTGRRHLLLLDELPFGDYSVFDLARYGSTRISNKDMVLMASRGCIRSCTFCGHWYYWPGYRQMSGERVYTEIQYQRRVMSSIKADESHIKFYDLTINGDMEKLNRLCDLLIADSEPKLPWHEVNAVIRPEMTYEMCRKLYEAGCRWLIIGLESGSQRVLNMMRKRQKVDEMKESLRNMARAGLQVRGNFMFGYPGETEEDFQQTLDFIKEMWPFIHLIYPSYTMSHLDGLLASQASRYGVDSNNQHTLYWNTRDHSNDYLVRLERLTRFREHAVSLGANLCKGTIGVPWDAYIAFCLGGYYRYRGDKKTALAQYKKYLEIEPANQYVLSQVRELEQPGQALSAIR